VRWGKKKRVELRQKYLLMCWLGSGRSIPRRRRDGDLTVGLYTSGKRSKIAGKELEQHTGYASLECNCFMVMGNADDRPSRIGCYGTGSTTASPTNNHALQERQVSRFIATNLPTGVGYGRAWSGSWRTGPVRLKAIKNTAEGPRRVIQQLCNAKQLLSVLGKHQRSFTSTPHQEIYTITTVSILRSN
jgi:hypothetical protein